MVAWVLALVLPRCVAWMLHLLLPPAQQCSHGLLPGSADLWWWQ
jgi:hypothetical protein